MKLWKAGTTENKFMASPNTIQLQREKVALRMRGIISVSRAEPGSNRKARRNERKWKIRLARTNRLERGKNRSPKLKMDRWWERATRADR